MRMTQSPLVIIKQIYVVHFAGFETKNDPPLGNHVYGFRSSRSESACLLNCATAAAEPSDIPGGNTSPIRGRELVFWPSFSRPPTESAGQRLV